MTTPGSIPGLAIVVAGPAHAAVLAGLQGACFDEAWDEAAFAGLLATPGTWAGLAVDGNGEPLGFIVIRGAADEAEILTVGVAPGHRRAGVAARLLADAEQAASRAGVGELFLEVAVDNGPARAFYAARGFDERGRRAGYYRRGTARVDAIVLGKRLSAVPAPAPVTPSIT